MQAGPTAAPVPTAPPHLRQTAVVVDVTPASGAIGAACEVRGMAQKIKAATGLSGYL